MVRVEHVPVHGGSLRMYAARAEHSRKPDSGVAKLLAAEEVRGLRSLATYEKFAAAVADNKRKLRGLLESLRAAGRSLAAYGAPAKGNTLLNYCQIGTDLVPYTVDRSPYKVGRLTPGMHLPVLGVETLLERQPDYVLILAWNFADEIMRQQDEFRRRGGRFILPLPEPRVV